jgi:radical SAM superfamily enzyme YgiQ (UPF0313 family)
MPAEILFAYVDLTSPDYREVCSYHLGVGYLRAYLETNGVATDQVILDQPASLPEIVDVICERAGRFVGLTCYDSNYFACRTIADWVKKRRPECKIIVGGPTAQFSDEFIMQDAPAVDMCVRGPAEEALLAVLRAFDDADALQRIGGITYRRNGADVCRTELVWPAEKRLDQYPSPFLSGIIPPAAGVQTGILTSRGCYFQCTFCNFTAISNFSVRNHGVERVLDELEMIVADAEPRGRHLHIHDDLFTNHPQRMKAICRGMIERSLNSISYTCNGRLDTVDDEGLELLKEANIRPHFGLESASARVLRSVGKVGLPKVRDDEEYKREQKYLSKVRDRVETARRLGMPEISTSIILGLPGETAEDGLASIEFVKSLGVSEYAHNVLMAYPGTKIFDEALAGEGDVRVRRSPFGLPFITEHPYDPWTLPILESASQRRIAVAEQINFRRVISGRVAPEGNRYPAGLLISGEGPADQIAAKLAPALSMTNRVALVATETTATVREWQEAAVQQQVVAGKPFAISGQLKAGEPPSDSWRLCSPYLPAKKDSTWRFVPLSQFQEVGLLPLPDCAAVFLTLAHRADWDAFGILLKQRVVSVPIAAVQSAPIRFVDACRWDDAKCPALQLNRLVGDQDGLRPCFQGMTLSKGGRPSLWKAEIEHEAVATEVARECAQCPVSATCSKCSAVGPHADLYCRFKREFPHVSGFIRLVEDLFEVAKVLQAKERDDRILRLIRTEETDRWYVELEGRVMRYTPSDRTVSRLQASAEKHAGMEEPSVLQHEPPTPKMPKRFYEERCA